MVFLTSFLCSLFLISSCGDNHSTNNNHNSSTNNNLINKGQKAAGTRIRACMMELAKLAKAAKNDTLGK